jgi:hypothetical protein
LPFLRPFRFFFLPVSSWLAGVAASRVAFIMLSFRSGFGLEAGCTILSDVGAGDGCAGEKEEAPGLREMGPSRWPLLG